MKKGLLWLLVLSMLLACVPLSVSAAFDNTHINTGDMAADIVAVAETQIGYYEGSLDGSYPFSGDNVQEYGVWYTQHIEDLGSPEFAWEAAFVSWCADQADIPADIILPHAYCPYGVTWFQNQGLFHDAASRGGTYVPKAGDLVYFAPNGSTIASHIGIVRYVKNDMVYTVEGNAYVGVGEPETQGVFTKQYSLSYVRLLGYASPNYTTAIPDDALTSDELTIGNNAVSGVSIGTVADLKDKLASRYTLTVYENTAAVDDTASVKTGQYVVVFDGDTVVTSFVIAVNGDFDGDGKSNTTDVRSILRTISSNTNVSKAQRLALGLEVTSTASTSHARVLLRSLIGA